MPYLLDANVLIEAKNRHYGLDFCPGFWEWIIDRHKAGIVFSVESVGKEIARGKDELSDWCALRGAGFFLPPPPGIAEALADVTKWVTGKGFTPAARSAFLSAADFLLVGHAKADNYTVVTHERLESAAKKIKIPNACNGIGVLTATPFDMLRDEGARFLMGPHSKKKK